MIDIPRRRLSKFPIDYGEEIEVLVDKNILRSHVNMIRVERPATSFEEGCIVYDFNTRKPNLVKYLLLSLTISILQALRILASATAAK